MARAKKRPNKAKSIIAQPLFRSRQEQAKKGKGSYRREASQQNWGASVFLGSQFLPAGFLPAGFLSAGFLTA